MAAAELILVRHAMPEVEPERPPEEWALGDLGRGQATRLAAQLRSHAPAVVVSSNEVKAVETARVIAQELGVTMHSADGLQEHARGSVPWMDAERWQASVQRFFEQPEARVLGDETAAAAADRIVAAVDLVLAVHRNATVAVVLHGRVLSLFLERRCAVPALSTWQRLGFPAYVVLDRARGTITEVVPQA